MSLCEAGCFRASFGGCRNDIILMGLMGWDSVLHDANVVVRARGRGMTDSNLTRYWKKPTNSQEKEITKADNVQWFYSYRNSGFYLSVAALSAVTAPTTTTTTAATTTTTAITGSSFCV